MDEAAQCSGCGTALALPESNPNASQPDAPGVAERAAAEKKMWRGALWCLGGIAVTAITLMSSRGGGAYVVAWGAILFGAVEF